MSAMDGVSSEGACSMGDPIFLPLENALGKKPAKSVSARHVSALATCCAATDLLLTPRTRRATMQACCCKCKLRTGVLWMGISLVGPTWAETFLYFGLSFLSERGRGIFLTMAVSVGVGSAIMTHGLWQTYQRNLKGARCLFRFIVVAVFSLLIIMVTMPLWVDGVCVGAMNARHEREMDDCAKPTPAGHLCPGVNMTCGLPIVAIARPSGCTRNVDQTVLASCDTCSVVPECVPATTGDGCVVNPVVISEVSVLPAELT